MHLEVFLHDIFKVPNILDRFIVIPKRKVNKTDIKMVSDTLRDFQFLKIIS